MLAGCVKLKQRHAAPGSRELADIGVQAVFDQLFFCNFKPVGSWFEQVIGCFENCVFIRIESFYCLLNFHTGIGTQCHFWHNAMQGSPGHQWWQAQGKNGGRLLANHGLFLPGCLGGKNEPRPLLSRQLDHLLKCHTLNRAWL